MFKALEKITARPLPFEVYSASDLWTDPHIAQQMLMYHLNPDVDAASRNSEFIARSSQWIIDHFELGIGRKTADFGCGPGLYTTAFAQAGADVTGIDFSSNSIAYAKEVARKASLSINYINENYLTFNSSDKFDLITMIMCDFCVLSPEQRGIMLHKFYSMLAPGGAVLLDVYSLEAFRSISEKSTFAKNLMNGFWSADPYYGFLNRFKYEAEKIVLDKYTIVESSRTREVFNWLQYFNPAGLADEFSRIGFKSLEFYSDVSGSLFQTESNEFAIIARN
ncbi:class I SAM-dependent methyltransferase [Maridesulfovibrio sp. FT414]|uniref:class I SAM-dependent methyltransferase n=1 Tax=Maridesulfovibrio sp. FT414 TaxID=2979469 RepID=UPI003D806186